MQKFFFLYSEGVLPQQSPARSRTNAGRKLTVSRGNSNPLYGNILTALFSVQLLINQPLSAQDGCKIQT